MNIQFVYGQATNRNEAHDCFLFAASLCGLKVFENIQPRFHSNFLLSDVCARWPFHERILTSALVASSRDDLFSR